MNQQIPTPMYDYVRDTQTRRANRLRSGLVAGVVAASLAVAGGAGLAAAAGTASTTSASTSSTSSTGSTTQGTSVVLGTGSGTSHASTAGS